MSKSVKQILAIVCIVALAASATCTPALADSATAEIAGSPVIIEYTETPLFAGETYIGSAYVVGGVAYVPMLAFCETMMDTNFAAQWNQDDSSVHLGADGIDISLTLADFYMVANGRYILLENSAINVNGTVMIPIRDIAKVFGVGIHFNPDNWIIHIDTSILHIIASGDKFYDGETVYWLSRAIYSESGAEPFAGMIGVGNVIMNRLYNGPYSSVYDVVFAPNQFSVVDSGAIYKDPSDAAVLAAKLVLEGYNTVGNAMYFANPSICDMTWFNCNFSYVASIGNHAFYA